MARPAGTRRPGLGLLLAHVDHAERPGVAAVDEMPARGHEGHTAVVEGLGGFDERTVVIGEPGLALEVGDVTGVLSAWFATTWDQNEPVRWPTRREAAAR